MKYLRAAKNFYIACSVMLCLIGVLLIVWPTLSTQVLCTVLGILSLVYGAEKIIGYFSRDLYHLAFQFDLALGIFVALIGVVLLFHPGQVMSIVAFIVGLFMLVEGVFKVQTAVDARRFGLKGWWLILLGALALILLGLCLLFDPFANVTLMVFVGISLLADGIQNLFNAFYTVRVMKGAAPGGPIYLDSSDVRERDS